MLKSRDGNPSIKDCRKKENQKVHDLLKAKFVLPLIKVNHKMEN